MRRVPSPRATGAEDGSGADDQEPAFPRPAWHGSDHRISVLSKSSANDGPGPVVLTVAPGRSLGFVGPNGGGQIHHQRVIHGPGRGRSGSALIGCRPYRSLLDPLHISGRLLDAVRCSLARRARTILLWLAHIPRSWAPRRGMVVKQAGLGSAARRKAVLFLILAGHAAAASGARRRCSAIARC